MQKIIIASVGIISALVIPVVAQESDSQKATQTLESVVVGELTTKLGSEAKKLESETLKRLDVDLSSIDLDLGNPPSPKS